VRLWIDTDVGTNPDDAVALLCAAGHPDVELVGVSTVDGDTEWRAEVARRLVDAPVIAGFGFGQNQIDEARLDAVLAIGPLTNIAALVRSGFRPARLAVMGGAFGPVRHRGAVRDVEHNFGSDPEAVQTVLAGGPDLLICPLDVTARMRVSPEPLERLVDAAPALAEPFEAWIAQQRALGVPGDEAVVCLHDPLALLALLGEPMVSTRRMRVRADADGRLFEHDEGHACDVVADADVTAAIARFHELVARAALSCQ
jgi:inosine-uridine nucleoside N-ribohydrolase